MKQNRYKIQRAILATLKIAGLLTMAALAPNTLQSLKMFDSGRKRSNSSYYLKTTIGKLHKQGLINFKVEGEQRYITLTEKGNKKLGEYQLSDFHNKKYSKWDGKWRIVIFDIKEYSRTSRNRLRQELINVGFKKIQNSVWVFPYDCEEFIFLLKTSFELGRSVLYLVVEKLENDTWVKKQFNLDQPNHNQITS